MDKIKHIIQGLYGISESEKMMPNENARFTLNKTIECLEKALEEYKQEIKAKAIDEFSERVIAEYHQLPTTLGYTEQIISEIAEQMKVGGENE